MSRVPSPLSGPLRPYAVVLLAFGLRAYHLGETSFIGDEAFSALLAREGALGIARASLEVDPHPPTFYLLLSLWRGLAGDSEYALRFPAAVAGTLLAPLVFRLGSRLTSSPAGQVGAALTAVNPFLLSYSQLTRMYVPAAMGAVASLLLWLEALQTQRGPGARYLAISLAGLSFHYFALLSLPVQALGTLLLWPRRALALRWLGAQSLVGLLVLGWLAAAWPHLGGFHPTWLSRNEPMGRVLLAFL